VRINRFIAASTGLSRRAADEAVANGRVTINGKPASAGDQAESDMQVALDGQSITPRTIHTYLALNKPAGYVSSRSRQGSDPTIYELLPSSYHHLRTAGRLDRDSSGLMLLSDDGDFIFRHTHPSQDHAKTYDLTLSRPFAPTSRERLEHGVQLDDGLSLVTVVGYDGPRVTVSLTEGRNRQLRRTFGALGYGIEDLHRIKIGDYGLGELKSGEWQVVSGDRGDTRA
jgi:23S rRNA pseudouridine2605 synthase